MFAYRLAKDLGLKVVDVLEMSTVEFAGWAAFYRLEYEETQRQLNKGR